MMLILIVIFFLLAPILFVSGVMAAISILIFLAKWGLIIAGIYLLIKEIHKLF